MRKESDMNENLRKGFLFRKYDAVNLAISFFLVYTTVYTTLGGINSTIKNILLVGNYLFLLLFLNAVPCIANSFTLKSLILSFAYVFIILISYLLSSYTEIFSVSMVGLLRDCIPAFLLGMSIRNVQKLIKDLEIVAVSILFLQLLSIFVLKTNSAIIYAYSQNTGYQTLIPLSIFFFQYYAKKKRIYLLASFGSILVILMSGSRGPLLCAVLSMALIMFINLRSTPKRLLLNIIILVIIYLVWILLYSFILNWLSLRFSTVGVSTRVLDRLISSSLFEDDMRIRMRNYGISYAFVHPLWGTGVLNDRYLIYNTLVNAANSTVFGSYCHNIFVELLMQFGLIPGLCVSAALVRRVFISFSRKNEPVKMIMCVLITLGFFPLMISRSYFTYAEFYLFVGYLYAVPLIK